MRAQITFSLLLAVAAAACGSTPSNRPTYTVQGQVLAVSPDRQQATVKHEEIRGFMMAMTMPYKVKDPQLLNGIAPGDLISATLVVDPNEAYLSAVKNVGRAPLENVAAETPSAASSGREPKPGEPVPDAEFVDQNGRKAAFSAFKGSPLAMTFIYTSCPLSDFCPRMDRNFAAVQRTLKAEPALKAAHLVTISFDPATDTPAVLKHHASERKADPARWTFLTGGRDQIARFAFWFGMAITPASTDPSTITHNLRTAIVDADGKLVKV